MTGAIPLWRNVSDGDLARAAAGGDRQAFAEIYDRYADRLYDFCVGMIGDRDAAADCVQDSFCVVATDLRGLREPDKLRPWLYSIVRHHAMRRLRHRYREEISDEIPDMASPEAGPDMMAGQSELARLVVEAAGGLSDRDRDLLELHYRHELDGPELAEALGVSLTSANTMVFRLRQTVERSLGALLVARGARANPNACPELATILKGWDGQLTVLMRKRIARHVESCHTCEQEQRRQVNPVALLSGAPVFIPAPDWLRDQTLNRVQLTSADSNMPDTAVDPSKSPRVWPRAALLVGVPVLCLGMAIVWFGHLETSIAPAIQIETDPSSGQPSPTTEAATNAPAPSRPVQPPPAGTAGTPPPTPQSPMTPEPGTTGPTPDDGTREPPPEESTPDPLPPVGTPEPPPAESTPDPLPQGGTPFPLPWEDIQGTDDPITKGKPGNTGGGTEDSKPQGDADPPSGGDIRLQDPKVEYPDSGGDGSDAPDEWPIPNIGP